MAAAPPDKTTSRVPHYRGRLAPSPTGLLHVGHARTFWKAYERARNAGGTLVMRMEDLDAERSRPDFVQAAYEDLRWLGIDWQEGPDVGGPFGPYLQSERHAVYVDAWRKLLGGGFLFPCKCSRKDLQAAVSAPHEAGGTQEVLDDEPIYPGACRPGACRGNPGSSPQLSGATHDAFETPEGYNWRFRVPDGEAIEFDDLNLGPQRFIAGRDFGDFIVWRRDGTPSYQLACVADDAAMQITEVVRGADLLKSTARQLLLYRALEIAPPQWFHCRLVVDQQGRRLAKRHDALALRTLRERGVSAVEVLKKQRNSE